MYTLIGHNHDFLKRYEAYFWDHLDGWIKKLVAIGKILLIENISVQLCGSIDKTPVVKVYQICTHLFQLLVEKWCNISWKCQCVSKLELRVITQSCEQKGVSCRKCTTRKHFWFAIWCILFENCHTAIEDGDCKD